MQFCLPSGHNHKEIHICLHRLDIKIHKTQIHMQIHAVTILLLCTKGAQIPGARPLGGVNFVRWPQIFVGPQYGTCFKSPFRRLEIRGFLVIFIKSAHSCFSFQSALQKLPTLQDLLSHTIPRTQIRYRECHFHLKYSRVSHRLTTNCKKMKCTGMSFPPGA